MQHLDITVTGKVQGVFFRASTKEVADLLGIYGWVMNHKDGSVRIEAEGDEAELRQFTDWLRQGPDGAKVEQVISTSGTVQNYAGFFIR